MCGSSKPAAEFPGSRTGQFSYCRDCRNAYDRRYYAEHGRASRLARIRRSRAAARAWMDALKAGRPCADCHETFPPYVMHWDHLPGHVKLGEVSVLLTRRQRQIVIDELAKCELVCANCHVMRTVRRARRTIAEGRAIGISLRGGLPQLGATVGVGGYEPPTSESQTRRATKLRHTP